MYSHVIKCINVETLSNISETVSPSSEANMMSGAFIHGIFIQKAVFHPNPEHKGTVSWSPKFMLLFVALSYTVSSVLSQPAVLASILCP
jgi:hypothetical protein